MVIWGRHRGGNEPDLLAFGLTLNLGSSYQPLGWFSRGIPLIGEEMPRGKFMGKGPGQLGSVKVPKKKRPGIGINPPKPMTEPKSNRGKTKPGFGINPPKKMRG